MCNSPYTMCLCCMYINAGQTLDICYSVNEIFTLPTCHQLYLLVSYGSYNNWNIIELTPKSTPLPFYDIHKVIIDRISENMASLVQSGIYGTINTAGNTTNGLYVIQFISEAYTLQNSATIDVQVISAGELVFKANIYLIDAIKHQLVLETTTTTATYYHSSNTQYTSSTSLFYSV